jgi:guanine nucleotide-binding protein subunit alpha, other
MKTKNGSWTQNLDRIFARDYIPSEEDIIYTRVRSTGISNLRFHSDSRDCQVFDVGGERSERKKWIHAFDDGRVVLNFVSLAGYDECLWEDAEAVRYCHSYGPTILTLLECII